MLGRFKVVHSDAGVRVSKVSPDVRVNDSFIYFNKVAIEEYFDGNYDTNLLVAYDPDNNEYLVSDIGTQRIQSSRQLKYQRYSNAKVCREMLANIGSRPLVKDSDAGQRGLVLAKRPED